MLKGSCSFIGRWGLWEEGGEWGRVEKHSVLSKSGESYLHSFLIRKPPNEGTWGRNEAMHKNLVS